MGAIRVKVAPDGAVTADIEGVIGQQCVEKARELLKGFNLETESYKPEFYATLTNEASTGQETANE